MVSCSGMHLLIHCIVVSHIVAMICHPVLSDLWERHSEAADSLHEASRRWKAPDRGPRELFLDCTADQNPTVLSPAV